MSSMYVRAGHWMKSLRLQHDGKRATRLKVAPADGLFVQPFCHTYSNLPKQAQS